MKLSEIIKIWEIVHVRDVGALGFCDLEAAIDKVVGVTNDWPHMARKQSEAIRRKTLEVSKDAVVEVRPNNELRLVRR